MALLRAPMTDGDHWLETYERHQRDLRFPFAFWLGVPLLVTGFTGLLWSLPVPDKLAEISPLMNWGSLFLLAALVYYFIISLPLAIGMLPVIGAVIAFEFWLQLSGDWLKPVAAALTLAGIAGLALGHAGRGGPLAVFRDVQLMMIAPLWALSRLYGRLGIPR